MKIIHYVISFKRIHLHHLSQACINKNQMWCRIEEKKYHFQIYLPTLVAHISHFISACCVSLFQPSQSINTRKPPQLTANIYLQALIYVTICIYRVTKYSEHNRMHTANLAIVFGPTLLWAPAEQAHNIAVDCIQQNNVVDILLNEFNDIFVEDNVKGKKKA